MPHLSPSIALIGAGPRGASLIERLGAHLGDVQSPGPLTIHVIDDQQPGAGRVWATGQTRELCMNTLSDAVTLFTEPNSTVTGRVHEGPTLYEWSLLALWDLVGPHANPESTDTSTLPAHIEGYPGTAASTTSPATPLAVRIDAIPESRRGAYRAFPARAGFAAEFQVELEATVPESHPSRALYGEYLRWAFDRAVAALPAEVTVIHHAARATGIERAGTIEHITLSTGETVEAHTAVLSTGWLPRAHTASEERLAEALQGRDELTWVRPASPVEQDLSGVAAGEPVIVRGLGMGFFDTMSLLTVGRGGVFEVDPQAPGGLRYVASGAEPIIYVSSGRGVPFRSKTLYGSLPPRSAQRYARAVDWAAVPRPIDFDRLLWPRIVADAHFDYAETLVRLRPAALTSFEAFVEALEATLDRVLARVAADPEAPNATAVALEFEAALAPFFTGPADRFQLAHELDPAGQAWSDAETYDAWVRERVATDLSEGRLGLDSAVKAGLWSISSARGLSSRIGTFGGIDAESRYAGFAELFRVGGMVGSGPPAFRNQQLLALAEAGLVRFIGPAASVRVTEEGFVAESAAVPGSRVTAPALIDAWMHSTDVRATTDPLTRSLVDTGRARPFTVPSRTGGPGVTTESFDIDETTGRLLGTSGDVDPALHAAGIPVNDTVHDTIISPMPGTDPTMLRETDRIAGSALRIALASGAAGVEAVATDSETEASAAVSAGQAAVNAA